MVAVDHGQGDWVELLDGFLEEIDGSAECASIASAQVQRITHVIALWSDVPRRHSGRP